MHALYLPSTDNNIKNGPGCFRKKTEYFVTKSDAAIGGILQTIYYFTDLKNFTGTTSLKPIVITMKNPLKYFGPAIPLTWPTENAKKCKYSNVPYCEHPFFKTFYVYKNTNVIYKIK